MESKPVKIICLYLSKLPTSALNIFPDLLKMKFYITGQELTISLKVQ